MEKKYYKLTSEEYHSHGHTFQVDIDWIVEDFISEERSGFIVQHFRRVSEPADFQVNDTEYYEAWRIVDGHNKDHGKKCDDSIMVSNYLGDSLKSCIDMSGQYKVTCDVYWVPKSSELYQIVDSWDINTVEQANGLKSSWDCPPLIEDFHVVQRPEIIHKWSMTSDEEIKTSILADAVRAYPNDTERDRGLLKVLLDSIFDNPADKRYWLKKAIYNEWEKRVTKHDN